MPATPLFRGFDPAGPGRIYVRHLPHWRQPRTTYFVTLRQSDSIPEAVLAEWLDIKSRWFQAHGLNPNWLTSDHDRFAAAYRNISESVRRAFEREQARMLHEELDRCHGTCVLRHAEPQRIVNESMPFFHGTRLWLGDFVIMPNHVHAILQPWDGWELEELLGSVKKWTSRLIGVWEKTVEKENTKAVGSEKQKGNAVGSETQPTRGSWQQESYDRIIRDQEELLAFRRYIANNPAVAKLRSGDFVYHRAEWLAAFAPL